MRIIFFTAMMILASTVSAGLYKWVDSEGNVHYSQKPPQNRSFKTIKAPPPVPQTSKPSAGLGEEENDLENTIKAETAKNQKLREKNCSVGKNNLKSYQTFRRIRDEDGNIRTIDAKERAEKIESAKQLIREFCGKNPSP